MCKIGGLGGSYAGAVNQLIDFGDVLFSFRSRAAPPSLLDMLEREKADLRRCTHSSMQREKARSHSGQTTHITHRAQITSQSVSH